MRFDSPWKRAGLVAGGYVVVGLAYIYVSSSWVAELDPQAHTRLETLKGFGFIVVTGLALLLLLLHQLRRLDDARRALVERTHALGRAERQATTAMVSAAIAHDMKNQLTVALASLDILRDAPLEGDHAEARKDLASCLGALRDMSRELTRRAREHENAPLGPVDLASVARHAARLARFCSPKLRRSVVVAAGDSCMVEADERDLEHATLNLVLNAIEATDGEGEVQVRVSREGDRVVLTVCDDGPGVPEELREKIFDPYFTTKSEGSGLGLATVRQVVERFHGTIAFLPEDAKGSCFRVGLPALRS